jgi:hypothetical protein
VSVTLTLDPRSGDYIMPFGDDYVRNIAYLRRPHRRASADAGTESKAADSEDSDRLQDEYTNQCLLWIANANSIMVRHLLKLISNLISAGGSQAMEHIGAAKRILRKLMNSEDTSAVFGAMLEGNDILAFYFRLIMQQESPEATDDRHHSASSP